MATPMETEAERTERRLARIEQWIDAMEASLASVPAAVPAYDNDKVWAKWDADQAVTEHLAGLAAANAAHHTQTMKVFKGPPLCATVVEPRVPAPDSIPGLMDRALRRSVKVVSPWRDIATIGECTASHVLVWGRTDSFGGWHPYVTPTKNVHDESMVHPSRYSHWQPIEPPEGA